MKTFHLLTIVLLAAIACHAQPVPTIQHQTPALAGDPVKQADNYIIRVEWKAAKEEPKFLEVLTTEGSFDLNTIQKASVKINNNDVPVTLKFSGSLTPFDGEKGRLQLFLGRTIPYVTSTSGFGSNVSSSYSQMSVGLNSTFVVHFGKAQVIQSDENGEISVLVKHAE